MLVGRSEDSCLRVTLSGGGEVSNNLESIDGGCLLVLVTLAEGRDKNGLELVALVEDERDDRMEEVALAES